ncbi:MAG: hypothetical protein A2087_01810 [Spirochaetes bacterium GWD1_61_31]|nr:MAG: hypothetical protein A2Y37_10175 [Spirochaetes bacterium GWB1_60_80]OHD29051.1 MAG: hypothetical protein A2004_14465 [Spirochaetes bacterium GWC1_61_12]OHD35915.1 MAG: hypothetical protein A2087_01810 [Spirochaetes bacterium GWD1_61_31]OHD44218.1 MAG: hypothetical protein A2Y35_06670 [Spirochaetes bacterium GWE1_60_18]OHD60422.1 MAG: hypothetical protein A2Y32_00855 [Spirochaetes bacterium GWF1_60_12]
MGPETSRILIVDDIEENLQVLSDTLTQAGFHPLQAKSGERALQVAAKAAPDLILLDIKMPGLDGFETIARLKADPVTADIPVIFISALNQIEDKIRGFQSGAVDYVSKPFQREEVVARVGTHVRLRQAQQAIAAERAKSDRLLESILPPGIAAELKETGSSAPRSYRDVSVLFTDLVDFTRTAAGLTPEVLITELNEMVAAFDAIVLANGCERIKTIGDAYFATCGIPEAKADHALRLATAGLQMRNWLAARNRTAAIQWEMRLGLHSGPAVAGIVGTQRYIYDVFGDTVNLASRLEAASEPMRLNASLASARQIGDDLRCTARGAIEVKGSGPVEMFWVES